MRFIIKPFESILSVCHRKRPIHNLPEVTCKAFYYSDTSDVLFLKWCISVYDFDKLFCLSVFVLTGNKNMRKTNKVETHIG